MTLFRATQQRKTKLQQRKCAMIDKILPGIMRWPGCIVDDVLGVALYYEEVRLGSHIGRQSLHYQVEEEEAMQEVLVPVWQWWSLRLVLEEQMSLLVRRLLALPSTTCTARKIKTAGYINPLVQKRIKLLLGTV